MRTSRQSAILLTKRVFPLIPVIRVPSLNERYIPDADAIVFSWWETAHCVCHYGDRKGRKVYFVRGYDIWNGNEDLVRKTYHFRFEIIVTSSYLQRVL